MSYRESVRKVLCLFCKAVVGQSCHFDEISNAGKFHYLRIELYRQSPTYKDRFRKKLLGLRTIVAKKKPKKVKERKVSKACLDGKHGKCYSKNCSCSYCNHDKFLP